MQSTFVDNTHPACTCHSTHSTGGSNLLPQHNYLSPRLVCGNAPQDKATAPKSHFGSLEDSNCTLHVALFHGWHFVLVHVPRTEKVKWYYATLLFIKVRRKGDHNSIIYRVRNVLDCSRVTRLEEIHLSKMHSRKIPLLRKNQAVFVLVGPSHPQRCCHKKQMLILPVVDYK